MFSSESGTQCVVDLVQRFFPLGQSKGHLVVSRKSRNGIDRGKIAVEHAGLYARQTNCFSGLRISTASYVGKDVLLNMAQTRVISFQIPYARFPQFVSPVDLVEKLSWRLRAADIPQFSGVLAGQGSAALFWILDQALDGENFYEASIITHGINNALGVLANADSTARVCDSMQLPVGNALGEVSFSLYTRGTVLSIPRNHLYECALNRLTAPQLDAIRRSGEIVKELRDILFSRLMDIRQRPETHWTWLSAFSTVLASFTDANQLRQCLIAIAESLSAKRWSDLACEKIPGWSISYEGGLQVIQENSRNDQVRLVDGHYSSRRPDWLSVAAKNLQVSQQEVTELRLTHLVPVDVIKLCTLYLRTPVRLALGIEDFIPAGRLVMRAA